MFLTERAPLRLTLSGGGTDLLPYYRRFGGEWISMALKQYVYVSVHHTFKPEYILKYSEQERVSDRSQIKHRVIRRAMERLNIQPGIEIASYADIPSGTGLGSSGTFTIALLKALYKSLGMDRSSRELATEACEIEMGDLGEPSGLQDPWIAATGGLTRFTVDQAGNVKTHRIEVDLRTIRLIRDHFVLIYTGQTRGAAELLAKQALCVDSFHKARELNAPMMRALETGNAPLIGRCFLEHWRSKRARTSGISNSQIDEWFERGMQAGAYGGKLVGAGGGGFLLFIAPDINKIKNEFQAIGLKAVEVDLDEAN